MRKIIMRSVATFLAVIIIMFSAPLQEISKIDFAGAFHTIANALEDTFNPNHDKYMGEIKVVELNINNEKVSGDSLFTQNVTLGIGDSETLVVGEILDENGNPTNDYNITWTASPADAVELHVREDTRYCDFTILETTATQVTISAHLWGQTNSTVIDISNNEVRFTSSDYYVVVDTDKLVNSFNSGISASAVWMKDRVENGNQTIQDTDFTFTSSDESILIVDNSKNSHTYGSGYATGKVPFRLIPSVYGAKEGKVTLKVETSSGASASCTVTVVALKEYKIEAYSEDLETPLADAVVSCDYSGGSLSTYAEASVKTGTDGVCTVLLPDVDACPSYPIKSFADFHPEASFDSKALKSTEITKLCLASNVSFPGVKSDNANISALSTEVGDGIMADLINFDTKLEFCDKVELKFSVDTAERKMKGTIKVSLDKTSCEIKKGHGNSNEVKEEHEQFKTLFKGINSNKSEKLWNDLRGKAKTGKAKFGIEADLAAVGYIEFDYSQGEVRFSEGGILLKAELGLSKNIYTSVPAVFVAFKLKGSVEAGLKLYQTVAVGVYDGLGVSFSVTFEIGASIGLGVGCDIAKATVGVEGKLKLSITLSSDKELTLENMLKITAKLSGFFEWKVELWVLKFGDKYSIDLVEAELYPNLSASFFWETKTLKEDCFELISRDYLYNDALSTMDSSGEKNIPNVYPNGSPQIVTLAGNRKLAVWLEDDGSKSSINRTTLVYSVYNNGQWSSAKAVNNTNKYDGTPKLVSDGDTAHLIWLRGAKVFDDNTTFEEFSKNTELIYSCFSNSVWSSPITIKPNNGKYPIYYSIAEQDGNATVSWAESEDNNVFLTGGTTTIFKRDMINDTWGASNIVVQTSNPLNSISSGYISGEPVVAYSIDSDGTMTTAGDNKIIINGTAINPEDGLDYLGVSYADNKFYFSDDQYLCWYDGSFCKTNLEVFSNYRISVDGDQIAVIMINQSGYNSELMVSYSNDGEYFTNPIYLTDYKQNISDFDAILNSNGSITYIINLRYVDNKEFGQTDLIIDTFTGRTEVSLINPAYDMDLSKEVKNTIFAGVVSNEGTAVINGFTIKLTDKNGMIISSKSFNQSLEPGEQFEVRLTCDIPASYDGSDLKLILEPEKDTDLTNNEQIFNFGYADLIVENCNISSTGTVTATITNKGYVDAQNVKAAIYYFNEEDVLLSELPIGKIARGETKNISYNVDPELLQSDSYIKYPSFKVEAITDDGDLNYGNNDKSVVFSPTRVASIMVSPDSKILAIGDQFILSYIVMPSNATDKRVYWFTSDDHVATVDSNGKVTGVGLGTATIKVITTDGRFEDECTVTVSQTVPVTGIQMQQTTATILEGQTRQMIATILPDNATNKSVTWSSDNVSVATVNSNGLVAAKKEGTAKITAKTVDGNYKAICTVTVTKSAIAVTGVSISDPVVSLELGDTKQLSAIIKPSNATNYNVSWSSDNSAVVSVNSSGLITAKKAGTAKITVTTADGGFKATCQVTVTTPTVSVTGIALSPSKLNMRVGENTPLSVEVFPANATNKTVSWESENPEIATVSSTGLVKAVSEGATFITVTTKDGNHVARCEVIVGAAAPSIEIKHYKETTKIAYRTTITFTAEMESVPDGAVIQWFKDGVLIGTGEKCTIKEVKNSFDIQVKIVQNGQIIAESKTESVEVNNGFFARLIAFFKGLFGKLPVIEQ